ncbi:MAG: cohesin domain-containing protein [Acidobacteriota bacterium]|nr:cohesin domain-containing protein [Acidobacteriota bacterium]
MNTNTATRRLLSLMLSFCLILPATTTAFANGKGKKNFNEGNKYEAALQWDLAAQAFALAVSAEPNNPEYRLHYLRALQQASLMYVRRGDALSEQNDYAGAYTAFRTAYNYDQGNEIARIKMERMLDQQKAIANGVEPVAFNSSGNVRPTADIQIASRPRNRDTIQNVAFKDANVKSVINTLGKQLNLNVLFDDAIKEEKMSVDMSDVTLTKAFDNILFMKKLTFEQMDRRTIIVYQDNATNKPRFEKLMVKAFYLGNINGNQARTAVTLALGNTRTVQTLDTNAGGPGGGGGASGGNILLVKATPQELQVVQQILDMVDKNKNEVVLDVEIYEVSHDSMTQIGNQIGTKPVDFVAERTSTTGTTTTVTQEAVKSAGLSSLGGFGLNIKDSTARAGNSLFSTGLGAMIGLPPTTISLLQSKGTSKLLNKTQIHVLDGQANTTKVGRSVPVRLGTQYGLSGYNTGQVNGVGGAVGGAINGALGGGFGGGLGGGIDSIQYRDVGLVIEATPTITNEGYVEVKMKFETSDVAASGSSSDLTPTFTQRSLQTVARIKDGVTSVVAGVKQDNKGDSRAGIPILGMIPILGRLFATPQQTSNQTDIVITVTPHIIRSAGITQKDYLAIYAGGANQGGSSMPPSIEDVVFRAQQEEEQERRLIALNSPGLQQELSLTPDNGTQGGRGVSGNQVASLQPAANTNMQPVANQQRSLVQAPATRNNTPVRPQFDNNSLVTPANSVTSSAPIAQPQMPEQTPTSISDVLPNDPAPGTPVKEGDPAEGQAVKPENAIPMAVPSSNQDSPERLEKMAKIKQMYADEAKKRADEEAKNKKNKKQPESYSMPLPDGVRGPKVPVGQALPTIPAVRSNINFSLSTPNRQQMGKNFNVTVEVNGPGQMMGATLAIRFDESKMQVRSVRSGSLFGAQPVLNSNIEKGILNVSIKSSQKAGVAANGQVIVIEFAAMAEGSTEIAFNNADTKVSLIGNMSVPAKGAAAQVVISRDGVASATNER